MKKYHNDIGSRLSEMLVSDQYTTNTSESLSQDFCMLTIDLRHVRSIKQRNDPAQISRVENKAEYSAPDVSTVTTISSPCETYSRANTTPSISRDQKSSSHKKSFLFHKLTCSLFLRKHMCSRCKRKSRSCLSNKTFSGIENRYICYRCRDKSQNIKNISKESALSNSSSRHMSVSQTKERVMSVPRKNNKDSGYDTVTSCSTVASAYSAFSTPANTRQNVIKDKSTAKLILCGNQGHSLERNSNTLKLSNQNRNLEPTIPREYSGPDSVSEAVVGSESRLSVTLAVDQLALTEDEFTRVQNRNVQKRYDGYHPEVDRKTFTSVLSDTSNLEESGDSCYIPPRIIRVSPCEKIPKSSEKACYTCDSTSKPCFRLPWEGGWVCEDCLDGLH